jgi:hypothetical protein
MSITIPHAFFKVSVFPQPKPVSQPGKKRAECMPTLGGPWNIWHWTLEVGGTIFLTMTSSIFLGKTKLDAGKPPCCGVFFSSGEKDARGREDPRDMAGVGNPSDGLVACVAMTVLVRISAAGGWYRAKKYWIGGSSNCWIGVRDHSVSVAIDVS